MLRDLCELGRADAFTGAGGARLSLRGADRVAGATGCAAPGADAGRRRDGVPVLVPCRGAAGVCGEWGPLTTRPAMGYALDVAPTGAAGGSSPNIGAPAPRTDRGFFVPACRARVLWVGRAGGAERLAGSYARSANPRTGLPTTFSSVVGKRIA